MERVPFFAGRAGCAGRIHWGPRRIKRTTSEARWTWIIGVTVVLTLLAIYVYYPYSPAGRQHRNMALAEQHLPKVRALVAGDVRFSRVRLDVYTGNGGSLLLRGAVRSEDDLAALKQAVAASSPPTGVTWQVLVIPPPLFDDWGD